MEKGGRIAKPIINLIIVLSLIMMYLVPAFVGEGENSNSSVNLAELPSTGVNNDGGVNPVLRADVDTLWSYCDDFADGGSAPRAFYTNLSGIEGWSVYWTDHTDTKPIYRGNSIDRLLWQWYDAPYWLTAGNWWISMMYLDFPFSGPITVILENATGYGAFSYDEEVELITDYYMPRVILQKIPVPIATTIGMDIDLTWPEFHQFDDVGTPLPQIDAQLAGYLVYRSTTNATWNDNPAMGPVSGDPNDWVLVGGTVNSPIVGTSWTDMGILTGSGNTYYYSIKPVVSGQADNVDFKYGGWGSNGIYDSLIGFDNQLQQSWNLISLPLIQSDESIDKVLDNITGKWDYIQAYDSINGTWLSNATFKPDQLNDLKLLNHKMAFWINITEPGGTILTVSGSIPDSTTISLYAGWNLVGYPTLTTETVANALWGTGADKVEKFDSLAPYRISEVGPTYVMKPGEGYWVHIPMDAVWIIDW
jgi:hypothetical protein